jgi:hypothetical protein
MYIKHLVGKRKGEIEDVAFEAARRKIEMGEAEDVYGQLPPPLPPVVQPEVVSTRIDCAPVLGGKGAIDIDDRPARKRRR